MRRVTATLKEESAKKEKSPETTYDLVSAMLDKTKLATGYTPGKNKKVATVHVFQVDLGSSEYINLEAIFTQSGTNCTESFQLRIVLEGQKTQYIKLKKVITLKGSDPEKAAFFVTSIKGLISKLKPVEKKFTEQVKKQHVALTKEITKAINKVVK